MNLVNDQGWISEEPPALTAKASFLALWGIHASDADDARHLFLLHTENGWRTACPTGQGVVLYPKMPGLGQCFIILVRF